MTMQQQPGSALDAGADSLSGARGGHTASFVFLILLLCSGGFAVGYRLLMNTGLGQGAALFIGLPIILGAVVAMLTAPRSGLGMALKVTTLCMCVIAPLMGEGAVCLAMAAPLVFGVVALTALIVRVLSRPSGAGRGQVGCCALVVGLSPLLWEPAAKQPGWEDRRPLDAVSSTVELAAPPAAVWQALAESPADLDAVPLPQFLRLRLHAGPRSVRGRGLQVGATREIQLDDDRYLATVRSSELARRVVFSVSEPAAGSTAGERIALWLRFVEVEFTLSDRGDGRTLLTQTTRYRRLLDPGFYFAPLERYGVAAMHRYTLALFARSTESTAVAVR